MAIYALAIFLVFGSFSWCYGSSIPYIDPTRCSTNQYFRFSSLSCVDCGVNLNVSANGLGCVCVAGYRLVEDSGGPTIQCVKCSALEVASLDGKTCVKCQTDADYDASTKTCKPCPSSNIIVEKTVSGNELASRRRQCVACTGDTHPNAQQTGCVRCSEEVLSTTSSLVSGTSCVCPVGLQTSLTTTSGTNEVTVSAFGGTCFVSPPSTLITNTPSIYTLRYGSVTVESYFFKEHLIATQQLCKTNQNFTACQLLGNLCVMLDYDETNYADSRSTQTDACREYLQIVRTYIGNFVGRINDWPVTMPWLYYKELTSVNVLDATDIVKKFKLSEKMQFVFAAYTGNGSFSGYRNGTSVLRLCEDRTTKSSSADNFAHSYKITCSVSVTELLKQRETLFYDGYLVINNDMFPIPVLVQNIRFQGTSVNENADRNQWRLTRRFFLVDNLSGKTQRTSLATVIRYASSVELLFRLRTSDGQIYPPLLKINYASLPVSLNQISNGQAVTAIFKTIYEMDTKDIERSIQITTGVLSALAVFYALSRLISWRKRSGSVYIDCASLGYFLVYSMSALSVAFFAIVAATCFLWLIFFKQQSTVYRFVPTGSQESLLKGLMISAFIFKIFDVIEMIYSQVFLDVFFIDWERPRGRMVSTDATGHEASTHSPVSIMRTLFVANEWRELQTIRKIKPTLQIVAVLFCLEVVGMKHLTTADPSSRLSINCNDDYMGDHSFVLRFAITSVLYLSIAVLQWVFYGFIYERFVADQVGDFVDFCSLSNVSVFVLSHTNFGYYIHGRSVHGRADADLRELYEQFKREEESLCGKRGLEPNSENQTFEMFLPQKFRLHFEKIREPLQSRDLALPQRAQFGGNTGAIVGSLAPSMDHSVVAYNAMNRFLSTFLEHSIRDCDYVVRDKLFLEKVLDTELQMPMDRGFFYNDGGASFTNILLCGKEWTLLLFDVLLFAVVDLAATNYVLAAIVTYLAEQLISTLRDVLGKKNIARKTLVDERFLL